MNPRVLLVSDRYLPEIGGSITWWDNVYRRFPPGTVRIVTQDYPDARAFDADYPLPIRRVALRRHRFLRPESLALYAKLTAATLAAAVGQRSDVMHVGKVLPDGYPPHIVGRLLSIPYITYAHGEEITIFSANPAYRSTLLRIYNGAAAVIANSEFTRGELTRIGVEAQRIHRISPGVDPSAFTPGERDADVVREYGLDGRTVLMSVGRLTRRKGHDNVLRALPGVLSERPDVVYLILSTGEEEASLKRLADELGVAHAVRFAGQVDAHRLPAFYRTCDVFVMANRTLPGGDVEGFGIVFLEANACERPVIAGDSGGTGEPVRDGRNGLRVDATDVTAVTDAVLRLARDPELRDRMGRAGRKLVEEEYSWDVVTERIRSLTREVAARRAR